MRYCKIGEELLQKIFKTNREDTKDAKIEKKRKSLAKKHF